MQGDCCCDCVALPEQGWPAAAAPSAVAGGLGGSGGLRRSTTTTVTLSRDCRSTAALVSTVAAMRAAPRTLIPFSRHFWRHLAASSQAYCRE